MLPLASKLRNVVVTKYIENLVHCSEVCSLNKDIQSVSGSACSGVYFWPKILDMGPTCPALGRVTRSVVVEKDMQQ